MFLCFIVYFFSLTTSLRSPCVIARNEAIFPHVMRSEVEASTFGTRTDPSTALRMTKAKDCFVVPPRNDAKSRNELCIYPNNKLNFLQIIF